MSILYETRQKQALIAQKGGARTLFEYSLKLNLPRENTRTWLKRFNISYEPSSPVNLSTKNLEDIALSGLTLTEAEQKFRCSKQLVHQKMKKHPEIMKIWEEQKIERDTYEQKKSSEINDLVLILNNFEKRAYENSNELEQFVYENAMKYESKTRPGVHLELKKLYDIFETYFVARKNKQAVSLEKIEQKTGVKQQVIGNVLRKVGLQTLSRPREKSRKSVNLENRERIIRALETDLTIGDIANLLNYSYAVVGKINDKKTRPKPLQRYGRLMTIYQTKGLFPDATRLDISMLLNENKKFVTYAMKNKLELEEQIKKKLEHIFQKSFRQPYLK